MVVPGTEKRRNRNPKRPKFRSIDVSRGPSDDELSDNSSIDNIFRGSERLFDVSRGPSEDELIDNSSIDDIFGGSERLFDVSRGPSEDELSDNSSIGDSPSSSSSSSEDDSILRLQGFSSSGDHPISIRLSDISRLTDYDG